jgi:hypothetical protein
MGLHLLNILFVLLLVGLPRWGYSRNQGYGPRGVLGLLLAIASLPSLEERDAASSLSL